MSEGVKSIPINGGFDRSTCDVKTEHGNSYKQTEKKKPNPGRQKMGFEKLAEKLPGKKKKINAAELSPW